MPNIWFCKIENFWEGIHIQRVLSWLSYISWSLEEKKTLPAWQAHPILGTNWFPLLHKGNIWETGVRRDFCVDSECDPLILYFSSKPLLRKLDDLVDLRKKKPQTKEYTTVLRPIPLILYFSSKPLLRKLDDLMYLRNKKPQKNEYTTLLGPYLNCWKEIILPIDRQMSIVLNKFLPVWRKTLSEIIRLKLARCMVFMKSGIAIFFNHLLLFFYNLLKVCNHFPWIGKFRFMLWFNHPMNKAEEYKHRGNNQELESMIIHFV